VLQRRPSAEISRKVHWFARYELLMQEIMVSGLKRYIRPGHVVSVIGHLGVLIVGLLLVSANAFHSQRTKMQLR
jgi:hypothetical protein